MLPGRPRVFLVLKCQKLSWDEENRKEYREDYRILEPCLVLRAFARLDLAQHYRGSLLETDYEADASRLREVRIAEVPLLGEAGAAQSALLAPSSVYHVVQRLRGPANWGVPLAAFWDRTQAAAFCRECTRAFQTAKPPFGSAPECHTSLPPEVFRDFLLDLGLDPPQADPQLPPAQMWHAWWNQIIPRLTPWQRAKLWEVSDREELYQVAQVECED
jgi:hypothetical protein